MRQHNNQFARIHCYATYVVVVVERTHTLVYVLVNYRHVNVEKDRKIRMRPFALTHNKQTKKSRNDPQGTRARALHTMLYIYSRSRVCVWRYNKTIHNLPCVWRRRRRRRRRRLRVFGVYSKLFAQKRIRIRVGGIACVRTFIRVQLYAFCRRTICVFFSVSSLFLPLLLLMLNARHASKIPPRE